MPIILAPPNWKDPGKEGQGIRKAARGVDYVKVCFFFLSTVTASIPADFRKAIANVLTVKIDKFQQEKRSVEI